MKKIFSFLLVLTLIASALVFTGCSKDKPLKLGLGIYTTAKATNATADKNGQGQATVTAAAVLVDDAGKIVKAVIDCADSTVSYTFEGKAVAASEFKTKYEQGKDYNMVAHGGAAKEWFEQADAFCALIVGKTAAEVKALVASNNKGTDEVINAGCTIDVAEFANAIEKAINNATETEATEKDTLKLGVSTAQSTSDANVEKDGFNQIETTLFAAALNADGKVVAASSECVQVKFAFDATGASKFDATKAITAKREAGKDYNMVAHGGAAKEWFEQAAAFDAACIGKTVAEIKGLMVDNYGNADLQAAGCTILVDEFVKAASKLG
ncbi:MAG: hypothetical protein IKJ35_08645 [Clostridia bacterium]|nr:hypothetical protein [Clostridia bacterium]